MLLLSRCCCAVVWLLLALGGGAPSHAAWGDHLLLDDPYLPTQWPLENTGQPWPVGCVPGLSCSSGTPDADLDWGLAFDAGARGSGVIIALGTPVGAPTLYCDDPEIAPRLWINPGEIAGNGLDDDMNGFQDDVNGWDFASGSGIVCRAGPPIGSEWHDTQVAQIAAAEAENGSGGVGVASGARILAVVWAADAPNRTFYDDVLPYVTGRGARIVLVPYTGYPVEPTGPQTPQQACSAVAQAGAGQDRDAILANSSAVVIWGQPDRPPPGSTGYQYPACDPSALGVVPSNQNDLSYASAESPFTDLAAPGALPTLTSIASSWAMGHVAGVLALVLEGNPGLNRGALVDRLLDGAEKVGGFPYVGGRNGWYGEGRANAFRSLLLGDLDMDGVAGDGNSSGIAGDLPCAGSNLGCDDNCGLEPNPTQLDTGRVGGAGADGIGDACQCGDVVVDGRVLPDDVSAARDQLAGIGAPAANLTRCNVAGPPGPSAAECQIDDIAALQRALAGLPGSLAQQCAPALP